MAVFLNNKVGVKVNSVDLSDHVTAVTLNRSFDELEVTAMGDTGHNNDHKSPHTNLKFFSC